MKLSVTSSTTLTSVRWDEITPEPVYAPIQGGIKVGILRVRDVLNVWMEGCMMGSGNKE